MRKCAAIVSLIFFSFAVAAAQSARIQANDNRKPAGSLESGVLTLHLELRRADWYPESDTGPGMPVYALAEEGNAPQVPGPLLRVPQGTEIHVTVHNTLPATAVFHGLHSHPGNASDVFEVPAGQVRETRFPAGSLGTYQYWASAGGDPSRGRPYREDSLLAGAFVVDPPEGSPSDRVFVIQNWRSQADVVVSQDVPVINGKSWPHTERLSYSAGEAVRWRWINASDTLHPMHLHGSYYRVDSDGDGEKDHIYEPSLQRMVVTHALTPGTTMSTYWMPLAGKWLFHCHLVAHFLPEDSVSNALVAKPEKRIHDHGANHMAGLVMGITVSGERPPMVSHGRTRKLKLFVRERPASEGIPAGFSYQVEEKGHRIPETLGQLGPPLVLERNRPVEITVVNQLPVATAVHWHGIELESYYDGVAGWGQRGKQLSPTIEPGRSFQVRFTPPRSGTFIYHTHLDDLNQLVGGLSGPIIVTAPGTNFNPDSDNLFVLTRAGFEGSGAPGLLNGNQQPPTLHWQRGKRYRLRLIDIMANLGGTISVTGPHGVIKWRALAKDGADLPPSQALLQDALLPIYVGETYDFEYQPQEAGIFHFTFENTPQRLKISQTIEVE